MLKSKLPAVAVLIIPALLTGESALLAGATGNVHMSYHWHLHQPLYWPAPATKDRDHVQTAAESCEIKARGGGFYPGSNVPHPQNKLTDSDPGSYDAVFSKEDRIHIYQSRGRDAVATMAGFPDAGASVSYSGSLMDNVESFGRLGREGYTTNWANGYREANRWKTSGGFPKVDLVGITYHHALAPLLAPGVLRKEIQLFKDAAQTSWGNAPGTNSSRGFFPPELAFSRTMIPALVEEGFEWTIVAGNHLARTCRNYLEPDVAPHPSTGTWNTNPPNLSDMSGPDVPANQWWSGTLDGRGAKVPAPFSYQPHHAEYVDPETGKKSRIIVVPADDVLGYLNGYSSMGTDLIEQKIAQFNDPNHPSLVLMAHDGDNAWGGGNSYYFESVPGLAREAASHGYRMSTIQQYLADHPVDKDDVVHVEDGGWVNPEGDWGDPQFVKWLYPPARSPKDPAYNHKDPRTFIDPENGFSSAWRSWAVITAGANICETAEQVVGPANVNIAAIRNPEDAPRRTGRAANPAERCWHYYLAGLDSGFMYYGESLDDEVKQSLALNHALPAALEAFRDGAGDDTAPTIFKPQRWPYNPGGMGWGSTTRYQPVGFNGSPAWPSDFHVWSLVHDVSGVKDVVVKVRANLNDAKTPGPDNNTYAGGATVAPWQTVAMTRRAIDPAFRGDPPNANLDYFIQPQTIADHVYAKITGYKNVLVDYYVEATDSRGNTAKSPISHVWIGAGS